MKTITILRYLRGEMNDLDRSEFETQMATDQELRNLVEEHRTLDLVSDAAMEQQLLKEVEAVASDLDSTTGSKITLTSIIMIVLAIILITSLGLYFVQKMDNREEFDPSLYAASQYTTPSWPIERGATDYLSLGISYGLSGDMRTASSFLIDSTEQILEGQYWLAQLHYHNSDYENALNVISNIDSSGSDAREIERLHVLTLLQLKKTDEALVIINQSKYPDIEAMASEIKK